MRSFPIAERELRVRARQRRTYGMRLFVPALGLLIYSVMALDSRIMDSPAAVGRTLFSTLSWLLFGLCIFIGIFEAADSLSRERREGTLGLLFLTDLRGLDIVSGKLAASSVSSLYLLIGTFPILTISVLLGGVSGEEVFRASVALLVTLFFSVALSMAASACCRTQGNATLLALFSVFTFVALIPMGLGILGYELDPAIAFFLKSLSPGHLFYRSFFGQDPDGEFWRSAWSLVVMGAGALAFASKRLPHTWQDRPETVTTRRRRDRWTQWTCGKAEARLAHRRRLLDINAVFWLAARERLKPHIMSAVLAVLVIGYLVFVPNPFSELIMTLVAIHSLHFLLKMWVAAEAGRRFATDRAEGSLELLAATPMTVEEILRGMKLAMRRQFLWPVLVLLLAETLLLAGVIAFRSGVDDDERMFFCYGLIVSAVVLCVDMFAMAYTATWVGLVKRSSSRGTYGALWRVILGPWVIVWFSMCFSGGHAGMVLAFYFLISAVASGIWASHCRERIVSMFRVLAVNPVSKLKDLEPEVPGVYYAAPKEYRF